MKHPVGLSQNGAEVYAYLTASRVGKRLSRQPYLLTLAKEMLAAVTLNGAEVCIEYDLQRQIGYDFIIGTTDKDAVFYACLVKDDVYTRFVKSGNPAPTSFITVMLQQDDDKHYELSDIWIGRLTPPRPGSADETAHSKPYWSNHALILGDQPLQSQTMTKISPY